MLEDEHRDWVRAVLLAAFGAMFFAYNQETFIEGLLERLDSGNLIRQAHPVHWTRHRTPVTPGNGRMQLTFTFVTMELLHLDAEVVGDLGRRDEEATQRLLTELGGLPELVGKANPKGGFDFPIPAGTVRP